MTNAAAQRRRREKPEAREVDKAYARSSGAKAKRRAAHLATVTTPEGWARRHLSLLRYRAKKKGLEFDLRAEDIAPPEYCPVLGIQLMFSEGGGGRNSPNSPSVDRFDNRLGYTSANVRVISNRANQLKSDATLEEVRALLSYMEVHHYSNSI